MRKLSCVNPSGEDALSCFLDSVQLKVLAAQTSDLISPWNLHCSDKMASFYAISGGRCFLGLDDSEDTYVLDDGDLAVLLCKKAHYLRNGFPKAGDDSKGAIPLRTTLIRGTFTWDESEISLLLPEMPPVIHVPGEKDRFILRMIRTMRMITEESISDQLGLRATIQHLAFSILVHGIRAQISASSLYSEQVLGFMNQGQVGAALYVMHTNPQEDWSLISLAKRCGMSRSAFSQEFKRVTGQSPMEYLLELRMQAACDLLSKGILRVKEVSIRAGYASQPAFNNAFKRRVGVAPGAYRKAWTVPQRTSRH
jgi:AraC-like DNA-binding protein